MAESTSLVTIPKAEPLPNFTTDLTPVQKGWLVMAHNRDWTTKALEKAELDVQQKLKGIEIEKDLATIQKNLKEAKEAAESAKAKRLFFTNTLKEKLIDKLMAFEKRNDVLIASATARELERRKEVDAEAKTAKEKANEIERYKAHIKNEFARIETAHKLALTGRINFYYKEALSMKKMNKKELNDFIQVIKDELPLIELLKPVKFERVHVSIEEAKAIVAEIPKYNHIPVVDLAISEEVDEVFQMYQEDIKNALAAKEALELSEKEKASAANSQLAQDTAMNNLVASAELFVAPSGTAVKTTVKKTWAIVEENTSVWAVAVMTNFITNIGECQQKLMVKNWEKLSLGQMAAALSKFANDSNPVRQFENLTMKEVIK